MMHRMINKCSQQAFQGYCNPPVIRRWGGYKSQARVLNASFPNGFLQWIQQLPRCHGKHTRKEPQPFACPEIAILLVFPIISKHFEKLFADHGNYLRSSLDVRAETHGFPLFCTFPEGCPAAPLACSICSTHYWKTQRTSTHMLNPICIVNTVKP